MRAMNRLNPRNHFLKSFSGPFFFFFVLLNVLFVLSVGFKNSAHAEQPLRLALNWKAEPQFGGFYAAQNEGIFKKEKLDVQIQQGGSGSPTIQMLAAGQVEYAIVSADEILLSHDRGAQDVRAIFATYQKNPQAIMTHSDRSYKTLSKLLLDPKATLLWQAGLPYAQYLKNRKDGLKVKTAPYLGGIGNFQQDPLIAQQCFATSEPLAAKKAKIATKVFLIADEGYNPYTTVLVTKASRLKKHPEEVRKMVAAVRQGWALYLKDPTSTNRMMQTLNKAVDQQTFTEGAEAQRELIQPKEGKHESLGTMTEVRWKTLGQQLLDLKLIKKIPAAPELFENL